MRRNLVVILVVLILLAIGLVTWVLTKKSQQAYEATKQAAQNSASSSKSSTWAAVPANITVPGKGDAVPANVAPPTVVGPASNDNSTKFRQFKISVKGDAYTPNTIIVNKGDDVYAVFTAVDKNYEFDLPDYGYKVVLPQGVAVPIHFGATASGKFTFYCGSCGGPASGPVGYLIVAGQ